MKKEISHDKIQKQIDKINQKIQDLEAKQNKIHEKKKESILKFCKKYKIMDLDMKRVEEIFRNIDKLAAKKL